MSATTVSFQLNWKRDGFQAPYFLGERGMYAEEGLDVQFVEEHGSPFAAEQSEEGCRVRARGASAVLSVRSAETEPLSRRRRHPEDAGGGLHAPRRLRRTARASRATRRTNDRAL